MKTLLHTTDLTVGFPGKPLIKELAFEAKAGELCALIGTNGCGKSTLLRTLAGLQKPLGGSVHLIDRPLESMGAMERARALGMVLTVRPQAGLLDVRTLVSLGRQPWTGYLGRLTVRDHERVVEAMERTGTLAFADRGVHALSDGELQMVLIARAVAQDTPVMLLDEPTAFLDLVNRVSILRSLRGIASTMDRAIILSTHDLQAAMELCDRILLVHDGRLWAGTPEEANASGILQQAFSSEGITFDAVSGALRVTRQK